MGKGFLKFAVGKIFKLFLRVFLMGKSIGIISLKGGVGKTSVTASLGDALASFGKRVLLVDGNLSAPNLGLHFDVGEPEVSLHHVLARKAKPSDAIHALENVDLLPASITKRIDHSPLKLKDRLRYLKNSYDAIVMDSSPSLNEETLGVMLAADEILVVTTPDYPTLSNTLKAINLARLRGTPISGLILNKVYGKDFEFSLKEIENFAEVPVMAVIPHDVSFSKALADFKPYHSYKPKSQGSEEFKKLAASLVGEKYTANKLRRFLRTVSPKKQDINRAIYYDGLFR